MCKKNPSKVLSKAPSKKGSMPGNRGGCGVEKGKTVVNREGGGKGRHTPCKSKKT